MAAEYADPFERTFEENVAIAFRTGNLSFLLHEHQMLVYEAYRAFEARVIAGENDGPPIFVLDCARRWGKTFLVCLIKGEDCLRRPRSLHTLATAFAADIGEIVIPLLEDIFELCPDDCRPTLRTSSKGQRLGFYFPNGSILKLVGVDKQPKGLRGRRSDGHAWTEAAFFESLVRPVGKVLHQFQRVVHACLLLESSAPEDPEHDFDEVFVPDAKRRGAYVFQTIDDNTQLTEAQKRKYWEDAAKVSVAEADRELFGKRSRDLGGVVIPEYDQLRHVRAVPIPKYARCVTADDPGLKHLNGLVLAVYDFEHARIIVQDSWAGQNAGSPKVAAVTAAREYHHWGSWPHPKMARIPLESTELAQGWADLLRDDKHAALATKLWELSQVPATERPTHERGMPGRFIRYDIDDHLTFWDGSQHRPNPDGRVSDIDYAMIGALSDHYGLEFLPTNKDDLHSMVNVCRSWVSQGRLVFLPDCGPVLDHVRVGKWNTQRTKFAEHRTLGHYDVLAALVYLVRFVEQTIEQACPPTPPASVLTMSIAPAGNEYQERLPWVPRDPHEVEFERRQLEARSSSGGRMRAWDDR